MEPKRLRFSDLSSDSDSRSSTSHSLSGPDGFVLRLSTSFSPILSSSTNENRDSHENYQFLHPAQPAADSNPSRHSCATVASGTTVWTIHGSSLNTMGVAMPVSSSRSNESMENTERIDKDALKLRRRTVATVSSNNSSTHERATTPTVDLFSSVSPTVPIQRKMIVSIADDTDELPPTQPSGPLKDVVSFVEVFSGADDRSALIGNALRDLGATVCQRLVNKVTHVVFREGRQSTLERARAKNIFLVSVLWVEACERDNERVSESAFPVGQKEKNTPSLAKDRRFRSMQPRPQEAELALTDDRMRKRKQRLEASKQKRDIRKDIREGRLGMTSTIETSYASSFQTPATVVPLKTRSYTDNGRWMSGDDDDTPESLRRQVADVRKKILGPDTPSSRRKSAADNENLAGSIRKKLFDDEEGKLHGTPVPPFLDRSKRITRSMASVQSVPSTRPPKSPITIRDMNSFNGSRLAQMPDQLSQGSKINETVNKVCEKVATMTIGVNKVSQSTKRRIFDRTCERISDGLVATQDLSGKEGPSKPSLTTRVAAKNSSVDIDDIFGTSSTVPKDVKRKATSRKAKCKTEIVRLRSSLFHVKSSSDIVRQLQVGRRSSEDFCSPIQATKAKAGARNRMPSKTATVCASSVKRRSKSRRPESTRGLVLTNMKQDDRELIYAIVKRMKGFRIQNKVAAETTHVICGENKRTLAVLMGVARGCWMLPIEWVFHSLSRGSWLPEDQFELFDQFPAAREIRKRKKTVVGDSDFLPTCNIFTGVGPFYVSPTTQPPLTDICSLIRWCGGKIALTSKRASFCVGIPPTHEDAVGVKETWILDSVMQNRLLSVDPYLIN